MTVSGAPVASHEDLGQCSSLAPAENDDLALHTRWAQGSRLREDPTSNLGVGRHTHGTI